MGHGVIVAAFVVIIVGGIGSLTGAVVAAVLGFLPLRRRWQQVKAARSAAVPVVGTAGRDGPPEPANDPTPGPRPSGAGTRRRAGKAA